MTLEEVIAEAMIRATTAPAEAADDAVKNAREDDGTLWHFARVQARVAIEECAKVALAQKTKNNPPCWRSFDLGVEQAAEALSPTYETRQ
jgi:hypothetical protein